MGKWTEGCEAVGTLLAKSTFVQRFGARSFFFVTYVNSHGNWFKLKLQVMDVYWALTARCIHYNYVQRKKSGTSCVDFSFLVNETTGGERNDKLWG